MECGEMSQNVEAKGSEDTKGKRRHLRWTHITAEDRVDKVALQVRRTDG